MCVRVLCVYVLGGMQVRSFERKEEKERELPVWASAAALCDTGAGHQVLHAGLQLRKKWIAIGLPQFLPRSRYIKTPYRD